MKKTLFLLLALLGASVSIVAQQTEQISSSTRLVGKIVNEEGLPISNFATVTLGNQNISTTANERGEFSLSYLEPMDEELIIEAEGYISNIVLVQLLEGQTNDAGTITLYQDLAREAQEEVLLN